MADQCEERPVGGSSESAGSSCSLGISLVRGYIAIGEERATYDDSRFGRSDLPAAFRADEYAQSILWALPITGIGLILLASGTRLSIQSADDVRQNDARPSVLYLRSFKDDIQFSIFRDWRAFGGRLASPLPHARGAHGGTSGIRRPRSCIGTARRTQPPAGAARRQFNNKEWHTGVIDEMSRAASRLPY
jgi:hypothetical protein